MSDKLACCGRSLARAELEIAHAELGARGDGRRVDCDGGLVPARRPPVPGPGAVTACEKPAGAGPEVHRLPVVTLRRDAVLLEVVLQGRGVQQFRGLRVSVSVPSE